MRVWAVRTLGPRFRTVVMIDDDHPLITTGPYRLLRHPSYAGSVLTLAGILLGLALGASLPLLLAPLIQSRLAVPAAFGVYPGPLVEAAVYGLLAALVFTLWPLALAAETRAAVLFQSASGRIFR